jgi:two-component system chemotaxis sensor kinase CheA
MSAAHGGLERGFVSVGAKLAGATIAVMLILAAVLYTKLSAYQRENLLQAKQMAATAVTRLFAYSCAAPIVFADRAAIEDFLANLGRGDDVPYASVWSSNDAGQPNAMLGQLGSGPGVDVVSIPAALETRREANRLVLLAPVRDPDGKVIGVGIVTFSLARENQLIAQVRSNTLLISGGIAAGISLLLLAIARFAIVRPLGKLVLAANKIERGASSDIDVHSRDEIGQLASAFRSMSLAITSREERIRARNQDMRLVLDNVGQGFLTLDTSGRVSEERSRVVEEWFGEPERGAFFWGYIGGIDRDFAEGFELHWGMLSEDILPLELCLDQLPRLIDCGGRVLELAYRPILEDARLRQLLVVITDISARIERDRALGAERETMTIFQHIVADGEAFREFLEEGSALVEAIAGSAATAPSLDRASLMRAIHTLKGNCAVYGVESLAEYCHELETALEASALTDSQRHQLTSMWARVRHVHSQFSVESGIMVKRDEHRALVSAIESHAPKELVERLASWQYEQALGRLNLVAKQIHKLAHRLGKGDVRVVVQPTEIRLPAKNWAPVWAVLSHLVRNTVDHGIESPDERAQVGKATPSTVMISLIHAAGEVVLALGDDGRGIDWQAIKERGTALGLPVSTELELALALFTQGVSSRQDVTGTSGRGVGLNAVREAVSALGGRISIESSRGVGTTFRLHFPDSMLTEPQDRELGSPTSLLRGPTEAGDGRAPRCC